MTEEEINGLKVGNKFTVSYTVKEVNSTSVYAIDANCSRFEFNKHGDLAFQFATLVKPTPTFEKGDIVCITKDPLTGNVYGRDAFHDIAYLNTGTIVQRGPLNDFEVAIGNTSIFVNVHCLTLEKKAEKDRYKVKEGARTWNVISCAATETVVSTFVKTIHPNAKAAAEAECDRLNAEWRAQQEGCEA